MASVVLAYVFPSLGVLVASLMFLSPLKAVQQAKAEGLIGARACAPPLLLPATTDPAGSAFLEAVEAALAQMWDCRDIQLGNKMCSAVAQDLNAMPFPLIAANCAGEPQLTRVLDSLLPMLSDGRLRCAGWVSRYQLATRG